MLTLLKVISYCKLLVTNGGTSVLRVRSLVVLVSGFPSYSSRAGTGQAGQGWSVRHLASLSARLLR